MTDLHAMKHFVDLTGRSWEIRELSPGEAREIFPNELFFEDPPTVSLSFVSGEQHLFVAHAPAHWCDLSFTGLSHLLRQAASRAMRGGVPGSAPSTM